jgi:hypothetical protein
MTTIHRNDIAHLYINMINDKTSKDICWCYNQQFNGIGLYTEGSLHDQMKMWRTMALEGKIEIMNYNNMKRKTFDGKEWYIMVIQPKEDDDSVPLDPVGMMLLGVLVSGFVYCFESKKNRNDVAKWVMRKLDRGEKRNDCCICEYEIEGYGNNPTPVSKKGRCCDKCNTEKVIPARILEASER